MNLLWPPKDIGSFADLIFSSYHLVIWRSYLSMAHDDNHDDLAMKFVVIWPMFATVDYQFGLNVFDFCMIQYLASIDMCVMFLWYTPILSLHCRVWLWFCPIFHDQSYPYAPCITAITYIYLHHGFIDGGHVGKYSKTMKPMGHMVESSRCLIPVVDWNSHRDVDDVPTTYLLRWANPCGAVRLCSSIRSLSQWEGDHSLW